MTNSRSIRSSYCACGAAVLLGLASVIAFAIIYPGAFAAGYLNGLLFVTAFPVGVVTMCFTFRLTGGRWGPPVFAAAEGLLPLAFVLPLLALPMLFGLHAYEWALAPLSEHAHEVQHRIAWINIPWVIVRAAVFLALLLTSAWASLRWYHRDGLESAARHSGLASAALVALVITLSFVSIDWLLTMKEAASSSIFGLTIYFSMVTTALAAIILILVAATAGRSDRNLGVLRDLGALLLAALILDFYMAFSQFFIIWNGDLPGRISWYLPRFKTGWAWLTWSMVIIRYAVPIPMLISRRVKKSPTAMSIAAGFIVLGGILDCAWQTLPSSDANLAGLLFVAAGSFLALTGLAAAIVLHRLSFGTRRETLREAMRD